MKKNERAIYLRPIEIYNLKEDERKKYLDSVMSLRKEMRALLAYQEANTNVLGERKTTISNSLRKYALEDSHAEVNAKILRIFFGDKKYFEQIRPIYEDKALYESSSDEYKKHHAKVYSPIDYMDIPTLYYFYKFRQGIIRKLKENEGEKQKYPYSALGMDRIIHDSYNEYFSVSNNSNMFYDSRDLKLLIDSPITSYRNVSYLQERFEKNIDKEKDLRSLDKIALYAIDVKNVIKSDVNNYMISYVAVKEGGVHKNQIDDLKIKITERAIEGIRRKGLFKIAENYLIDQYNYANLSPEEIQEVLSRSDECNKTPEEIQEVENKEESVGKINSHPSAKEKQSSMFSFEENIKQ